MNLTNEKKTILLVEDELVVRELLKGALEPDYHVLEASSYFDAIQRLNNHIDLAIIDYILPYRDGFEVIEVIKRQKPLLPIIIITAYGCEELAIKALRINVADYMKKPLSIRYLRQKIAALLNGTESGICDERVENRDEFIADGLAAHIEDQYSKDLTRDRLASLVYIDKSKLSKIFKKRLGKSIPSFINCIRVKKAAELFKNPDLTISEIAQLVGYGSLIHFERMFKKIYGLSPRDFKKRLRELLVCTVFIFLK